MILKELKDKKILILGFGREGKDTFSFLKKLFPGKKFLIADKNPNCRRAGRFAGKNYLKALQLCDLAFRSPGIPLNEIPEKFRQRITSQTKIFFDNCPGTIVGVTGTKGKSTTAFWIWQTLKKGGIKAKLVGNIGKPALSFLPGAKKNDVFVYELSSHQLQDLKKSPKMAVLLNVYKEHLDYYGSFKKYIEAKSNIAEHQKKTDYLIYNSGNEICRKIAKKSGARKIPIKGKYYSLDRKAVGKVAKIFKVPEIEKLQGLPHRMEYVGRFKGIDFYNDSLSTIPEAAMEALDFLGREVETMILGGFDRGVDFKKLGSKIEKSGIKNLILFPETGNRISKEVKSRKISKIFAKNMEDAVRKSYFRTSEGKICLLSPASPSFGLFKDYAQRGNLFKKYIKQWQRY